MIRVAGIDIGFTRQSPLALVVIEFNPKPVLITHDWHYPRRSVGWEVAIDDIGEQLASLFGVWGFDDSDDSCIDLLAYELPHVRSNVQTAIKLAHLCGIVRRVAKQARIPIQAVQPTQAKQALTKSGAATKQQMVASAHALFGVRLTEHEADACGVALAGALLAKVVA